MIDCRRKQVFNDWQPFLLGVFTKDIKPKDARDIAAAKRGAFLKGEAGIGPKKKKDMPLEQAITVKLNSTIRVALARMKRGGPDDYIFGKPNGEGYKSIRTAFNNTVSRAKLKGVTIHTLRRTFASRLVIAGVDLPSVQKLGGWNTLDMVLRYAHLSLSQP